MLYHDRIDVSEGIGVNKMMSMNLSDIAILNIKRADYPSTNNGISKSEAINLKIYNHVYKNG